MWYSGIDEPRLDLGEPEIGEKPRIEFLEIVRRKHCGDISLDSDGNHRGGWTNLRDIWISEVPKFNAIIHVFESRGSSWSGERF